MHVVYDLTFPARNRSGIGVYGYELLAAMRGELNASGQAWTIETFKAPGVLYKPDFPRKLADAAGWLWGVEAALPLRLWGARKAQVLHAPAFIAPLAPLPCPLVITVHDTILEDGWESFPRVWTWFHRLSVRAGLARAAAVVPTLATAADLARVYGVEGERVHVIPYGLSADFRPLPDDAIHMVRARFGLARPYLLYVGARARRKNLVRLLEAFARLRATATYGDLELVLAGPPGNASRAIAEAVGRLGLDGVVRLAGFSDLSRADLVALYNGAQVFVYPSLYEGGGLPPLEAMACGVPVVVGRTPAVCELTGDAALSADPASVDALAEAITRALSDETLRGELRARGLARAAGFSWRRAARTTLALYEAVRRSA